MDRKQTETQKDTQTDRASSRKMQHFFRKRRTSNAVCVLLLIIMAIYLASWVPSLAPGRPIQVLITGLQNIDKCPKDKKSDDNSTTMERPPVPLLTMEYTMPGCSCFRVGLERRSLKAALEDAVQRPELYPEKFLQKYSRGESTCSGYATQRGAGQKVVAYSYYTPNDPAVEPDHLHYLMYLNGLNESAKSVRELYPGWVMRIYHNVTSQDRVASKFLCHIFCRHDHVDLCPVTSLPGLGDLTKKVVGRMWRFAVMGDPTVDLFLSRDTDSVILTREVVVVKEWLTSGKSFHVIRDHPSHKFVMLAGLWGGSNKEEEKLRKIREDMMNQPLNLTKNFDQSLLAIKLWPVIQGDVLQHDSYNCLLPSHRGSVPFPVRRKGGYYCGWGPFKTKYRQKLLRTICPIQCRYNKSWTHC